MARRAHPSRGRPGDHARTAGDIEHPLARLQLRTLEQVRDPRSKDVADDVALVERGRIALEMPLPAFAHRRVQPIFWEMLRAAATTARTCSGDGVAVMYCTEPAIAIAPAKSP